jgi:transcriptional regulator of acetoin/glycerol metabolism
MREMTSSPGAVVRARELFFNEGTLPQGLVQEAVLRSWQRCAQRGRDAGEAIEFNHVSRSALSASAERNRRLIMASESPILRLADAMKGVGYGILVTDREGACVAVHGPIDSCGKMLRQALRPGIDLSETAVATNAMALAMAEGRPIGLCGPEHFFSQNQTFQCVAAPIFDASGALAGSIDITRDTGAPRFGAVSLILNCAAAIETALFLQTPAHCLVTLSWNIDAVISTPPAIVAFGADGEVLAVSRGARDLLELGAILAKLRFQDLFHGSYAHFLDQASQSNRGSPLTLQSGLRIFARALVVKRGEVAAVRADAAGKQVQLPEFGDEGCQAALHRATRALGADLPVLLRGETGTGKEVAARALHANSARRRGNFIAINCGAIPRDLIEGELFGYADGAYTGARRGGARGRIEEANGGTLFLDEIGDMPLELQTRLLRVLESREVTRLGESAPRKLDFQLISATHQDLDCMVHENRFRSDLYFRVNGLQLSIPPLRQRANLAAVIDALLRDEGIDTTTLSADFHAALAAYHWPGNTRELRHALRYAKAMAGDDESIGLAHLPDAVRGVKSAAPVRRQAEAGSLKDLESAVIHQAVAECNGNITAAARQLGISRSTLHRRWKADGPNAHQSRPPA